MLDEKDLQAIAALLLDSETKTAGRIQKIAEKIQETDERVQKTDERIQKTDERIQKTDERIQKIDERIQKTDEKVQKIDEKVQKIEKTLLDEMGRVQVHLEKQISQVQKNVEELQQYYRITKLENDNTALLLRMIEVLQKDVEELKKKTA